MLKHIFISTIRNVYKNDVLSRIAYYKFINMEGSNQKPGGEFEI
jgi:hypothetical protein